MKKDEVATGFNVRRIFGDFNAKFALIERYRKDMNTRISDVVVIAISRGSVIYVLMVPIIYKIHRGCVG